MGLNSVLIWNILHSTQRMYVYGNNSECVAFFKPLLLPQATVIPVTMRKYCKDMTLSSVIIICKLEHVNSLLGTTNSLFETISPLANEAIVSSATCHARRMSNLTRRHPKGFCAVKGGGFCLFPSVVRIRHLKGTTWV